MQLRYAIKYVADMDAAVAFHRDVLGLPLRLGSPFWSEFDTGPTTLALHPAGDGHPPGSAGVGYRVDDLDAFHAAATDAGVTFTMPPTSQHGLRIAHFLDGDGAECSVSAGT